MDHLDAFAAAEKRIADLNENIAREKNKIEDSKAKLGYLEKELADMHQWVLVWHRLTGTAPQATAAERIENTPAQKTIRPKNPDREVVVDHTLQIIREHGKPLSRKEVYDALAQRGIVIHGKDPEMVLSTMLWRSQDRVVRLPGVGYWPSNVEWSDASYFPLSGAGDLLDIAAKEPEDGREADDADD